MIPTKANKYGTVSSNDNLNIFVISPNKNSSFLSELRLKNVKATVKSFFQKKSEFFFLHHIMQLFMTFPKKLIFSPRGY